MKPSGAAEASRLDEARNVWVATVRPDGRPHLVPVWFVVDGERWYLCTAPESVKARNLGANPRLALALEDGDHPVIVEGEARPAAPSAAVVAKFKAKYDWDIVTDTTYTQVFEVTVRRRVMAS
jgi:nitroimidazol reductase NimA-like FMN-containing flavoprotein (pyridoxamine 5'-phosphate oxidase superfamily)